MNHRCKAAWPALLLAAVLVTHAYSILRIWGQILSGAADFTAFYAAGRLVDDGKGPELYRFETQRDFQREFPSRKVPLLFYHPPYETVLFMPLAKLPFGAAYLAWLAINLLLVGGCAMVRHPEGSASSLGPVMLRATVILIFYPVLLALWQGQDSLLLLLLFTLAFVALKRGQQYRAGFLLGLGLFKFQLILPFLLVFAWKRRKRALLGLLSAACVVALVSAAIVGWSGLVGYVRFLKEVEDHLAWGTIHPELMPNLRGLLAATLPLSGWLLRAVITAFSAVLLLVMLRYWPAEDVPSDSRLDLAFSLTIVASLLTSYHLNAYDLTLLLLPIAVVWRYVWAVNGYRGLPGKVLLAATVLLFYPPLLIPSTILRPVPMLWVLIVFFMALAVEIRAASQSALRPA